MSLYLATQFEQPDAEERSLFLSVSPWTGGGGGGGAPIDGVVPYYLLFIPYLCTDTYRFKRLMQQQISKFGLDKVDHELWDEFQKVDGKDMQHAEMESPVRATAHMNAGLENYRRAAEDLKAEECKFEMRRHSCIGSLSNAGGSILHPVNDPLQVCILCSNVHASSACTLGHIHAFCMEATTSKSKTQYALRKKGGRLSAVASYGKSEEKQNSKIAAVRKVQEKLAEGKRFVEVTVPQGAHPGDGFKLSRPDGITIHAKVPAGFKPGMLFRVPVPGVLPASLSHSSPQPTSHPTTTTTPPTYNPTLYPTSLLSGAPTTSPSFFPSPFPTAAPTSHADYTRPKPCSSNNPCDNGAGGTCSEPQPHKFHCSCKAPYKCVRGCYHTFAGHTCKRARRRLKK